MLPSRFIAKAPADFCGHAARIAQDLLNLGRLAQRQDDPLAVMLLGPPGIGKSNLSHLLATALGADKWNTTVLNGTEINLESLQEIARSLRFTDMFSGYRVLRFEEIDKTTPTAQVRMLTLLDELPRRTAIIGTSNCKLEMFDERFQRRFTLYQVGHPRTEEISDFLGRHWPEVPEVTRNQIAFGSGGNVGLALKDLDSALASSLQLAA
jgi:MoxR-like ATPase